MTNITKEQGLALDLGYAIGQAREKAGLSIDQVALAIKLRRMHIKAIENGAFEDLPGEPYNRNYIRRYAEFLQMDAAEIIADYDKAISAGARRLFVLPDYFAGQAHANGALAVLSLLCFFVFVALWNVANPWQRAPLVMAFDKPHLASEAGEYPHRCAGEADVYPPCAWENTKLWYDPTKPENHIFAVENESTP